MIERHWVCFDDASDSYYTLKDGDFFNGFDEQGGPIYSVHQGKGFETEEEALLQAQKLNDISCVLNQLGRERTI